MGKAFKRMYSAQAIAIIMVILVVATVLGASLYSRTLKNKEAAINTKDSMMAIEQADSLLDLFVRADFQFLQDLSVKVQQEGTKEFTSIGAIKEVLDEYFVDSSILDQQNWCQYHIENNPSSNLKLTIAQAEPTDFVDVRVGSTRVFNLKDNSYTTNPCNIVLQFEARDNAPTIFAIKEIYGNSNDEIAEYQNDGTINGDDIKAYCFKPNGDSCTAGDLTGIAAPIGSFNGLEAGKRLTINLNRSRGGYPLYQIRIIPLNLTLGVAHSFPSNPICSAKKFTYMKVNAAVNCYGSFREKQIMVPGVDSLGYSSLFDYTIYNIGTLRPNN